MQFNDIISAFYQNNRNNCATIGIIKLAIAIYGFDNVFRHSEYNNHESLHIITLRNNVSVAITTEELKRYTSLSGFTLNSNADPSISSKILNFANLCFAVIVKYNIQVNGFSELKCLHEINTSGINSDYAYRNLGYSDNEIEFLLPNNKGTKDPNDYLYSPAYLLYNNNHCVMATYGYYDEYGEPTPIRDFVPNHTSLFKPGKKCWAYTLI